MKLTAWRTLSVYRIVRLPRDDARGVKVDSDVKQPAQMRLCGARAGWRGGEAAKSQAFLSD
jgi:hypothetical protein